METGASDYSKNFNASVDYMGGVAMSAYNVSVDSIKIALAIVVALAWYGLVKRSINFFWPKHEEGFVVFGLYTIIITILFAVVIAFINDFLGPKGIYTPSIPVMYAMTPNKNRMFSSSMMPDASASVVAPSETK